jgi:hypothetical protein
MPAIDKAHWRLAAAFHSEFTARRQNEALVDLPLGSWECCIRLACQIRRAQLRGWNLARAALLTELRRTLSSLHNELTTIFQRLPNSIGVQHGPSERDVYQDMVALEDEFEELNFDLIARWLSVTTDSIELEGVYLGPFEIQLRWGGPHQAPSYRVIAKDPHPAQSRDNVTHPHVMDEILCEGEGRQAIRQALQQGRIFDFFTLIAGVLRTYNSESPYVEFALWQGSPCSDCGDVIDEDDTYSCQKCRTTVCGSCESVCSGCDESCCSNCLTSCVRCENRCCRGCLKPCDDCQERVCAGCLDEQERCPHCHEDECSDEDEVDDEGAAAECATI